jgi:alkylated DNA repair dioxygenase AlkB
VFDVHGVVVDAKSGQKVSDKRYDKYPPRPLPKCLDDLRKSTEAATGCQFNFCLVNYYASGSDSISYHSDDERFLGPLPAIASFSLGARRDFLMKHKPDPTTTNNPTAAAHSTVQSKPLKLPLGSGDMILMRGTTQSKWLHSIPKRSGKNQEDGGRINITFRRAMTKDGTENYYNYNVGHGPVYCWHRGNREMMLWKGSKRHDSERES